MSAHAQLSPSSSDRWIACPGSIAAQAAVKEVDEGSQASREGTVAHALLELCILFGFDPQEWHGKVIVPGMPEVVQHMIDGVGVALEWLDEYIDLYGRKNLIVVPEHRVYIGSMIGIDDSLCHGTTDLQVIHRDMSRLVTFDYKHGVKPVQAEDNPQLMMYTLGGIKEHGRFKAYTNVICQPRAPKRSPVEETHYKHIKLHKFTEKASRAAQAALLPNAPRVAGDHCFFCKARDNCNTYRRRAMQKAVDDFGEIEDPETIPDEKLNDLLNEVELLQNFINAIRARALAHAKAGGKFADWDLGWGTRKRVFQNPEEVLDWCKRHKLPQDAYMPRELVSPKQLETVLRQHKLYPKKRPGQPRPESPIAHLVGYTTPQPVLKPRQAPSAEEDFADD